MLSYSVNTFLNQPNIDEVIIVCHKDWIHHVETHYPKCKVVVGGTRRQDSSKNGVLACNPLSENILIHDAARPFVSSKIISNCIDNLNEFEVVVPVQNSNNSLVSFKDDTVSYVNRREIKQVQTPQCFKSKIIREVFESKIEGTDEVGMALQFNPNIKIKLIDGDKQNFKITMNIDIAKAEFLISKN